MPAMHTSCAQCTASPRGSLPCTPGSGLEGGGFSIEEVKPKACSKATTSAKENQEASARSELGRN